MLFFQFSDMFCFCVSDVSCTVSNCPALSVDFSSKKGGGFGGMFGMLKGLVGSKSLTRDDMESVLEKMKDHLIGMMTNPLDFFGETFKSAKSAIHSSPL